MISHFQWQEKKNNLLQKEWAFSFYYQGKYLTGTYLQTGKITWDNEPSSLDKEKLEASIHDLMLYHVFEDHTPPSS
ncbi:DUF5342 family protein [Aliibacillus thermotolerans]|uniref:DUF5342 family protein n=1 Tax=Aliibacillus thermotolerans TaxID=1834418 RepID=A0ABW0U5N9_9BACI|nr:DUF5342 family protein [Aliibacillus thermotolerans]MDA3128574.1 hypothetical protein [Aliibacillus thermotolerans]